MINFYKLLQTWHSLKSMPGKSTEVIKEYQFHKFKKLIHHAYKNIPMYREIYNSKGFEPSDLSEYKDIELVPAVTKDIIRSFSLKDRVYSRFSEHNVTKERTSGSSGEPIEIWRSKTESAIQTLKGIRLLTEWGYSPFDHTVRLWDGESETRKAIIQKLGLFRRKDVQVQENPAQALKTIAQSPCHVLYATRSSLDLLAEEIDKAGIKVTPRILVSIGEILTNGHRKHFQETFACKTLNLYGSEETGSIAWQCPEDQHSLHIEMETVVVNLRGVEMTPNGKMGAIVVTNLENYVMPFIRYDLGDWILMPETDRCSCGRTLPLLGEVFGRNDDTLEFRGRKYYWNFFYNYFKDYLYVKKYKIVQTKDGNIEFRILLFDNTEKNRQRCLADLSSAFEKHFSPLNIQFVHGFNISPRGKFKVLEKES